MNEDGAGKPKFLTGTPRWMAGPVGVAIGVVVFVGLCLKLAEWVVKFAT